MTNTVARPSREVYAETRDGLIAVVRALGPEQVSTPVPQCPGWKVKDVVAHVCGIVSDILAGRVDGIGTDEWTARQVGERADLTAGQVCDEWSSYSARVDELLRADDFIGVRMTGDLIVHVHDVREALDLPIDTDDPATVMGAHRYVPPVQERAAERLGIGLTVELSDGSVWPPPIPQAPEQLSLRATPFDFLRSVTGRRTRREVEALDWTGDPRTVLDEAWTSYGQLRDA